MERTSLTYKTYLEILNRELVCAMGCTEPIAIAYCAAAARRALGALPTCIEVAASGNIIKNVKSVVVPNTGHLRGTAAAALAGFTAALPESARDTAAVTAACDLSEGGLRLLAATRTRGCRLCPM